MPTQEERLSALERSQIANNEQFAILLGVIGEQGRDIKAMKTDIKEIRTDMHSIAATLREHTTVLKAILDRLPAKE
jgi:hypothetical protein